MKNLLYGAVITIIGAGFYFAIFNTRIDLILSLSLSLILTLANILSIHSQEEKKRNYKREISKLSAENNANKQQAEQEKQRRARALLSRR